MDSLPRTDRIKLPGFGISLNDFHENTNAKQKRFPHALIGDAYWYDIPSINLIGEGLRMGSGPLLSLREYIMLDLMNLMTDKPNWEWKIYDINITSKWKKQALAAPGLDVSEEMIDWVRTSSSAWAFV